MHDDRFWTYKGHQPRLAEDVFIAPGAYLIGDVTIGKESSVWFGSVLRGDDGPITLGEGVNIQDGVVVHTDEGGEVRLGDHVTVGHRAVIHGCTVEARALIGMGAVVMDNAVVESGAMVAAGALVPAGKVVTARTLWAGCPARMIKEIDTPEWQDDIMESAEDYLKMSARYRTGQFNPVKP